MTTTQSAPALNALLPDDHEHPNARTLRALYADLSTIAQYTDQDVVLHSAERDIAGTTADFAGAAAVLDKELDLIRLTGGTLVMDVDHIGANDHFGTATGMLHAQLDGKTIAMPFCGLWRFRDGRIVEHWENAYDARALGEFLTGHVDDDH
jgi:ketosteroid isomerase-like protein